MLVLKNTPETLRKTQFPSLQCMSAIKGGIQLALKEVPDYISAHEPDLAKALG